MTDFEDLLTWRESSTSGEAIAAAIDAADAAPAAARHLLADAERIVITGAGSSYYLALVVAATAARPCVGPFSPRRYRSRSCGRTRRAVGGERREPVVIISRSGSTSEAVDVASGCAAPGIPTLAVTCRAGQPARADRPRRTLVSPAGDEAAIVMTRSFASMLALLLRLVAAVAGAATLGGGPRRVAGHWHEACRGRGRRAPAGRDRLVPGRHAGRRGGASGSPRNGASS